GQDPGHVFKQEDKTKTYGITGSAASALPLDRIEIIVNGAVVEKLKPANRSTKDGAFESAIDARIPIGGSSWIAIRCFEDRPDKRIRFAHTAPWHIDVTGKPLRPRREEIEYLIHRVAEQIKRSANVLPQAALDEYREALRVYQKIRQTAR